MTAESTLETKEKSEKEIKQSEPTKAELTRAKILQSARNVLETKCFNQSSVKDITANAGLGYGTFYLYFKDKKDLFNALLAQVEDELYAADGGLDLKLDYARGVDSYRALRKDLKAVLLSLKKHQSTLRISKELSITDEVFRVRYFQMRSRLIERTKEILSKSTLDNIDFEIAALAITGMIETAATESNFDIERILPTLTKLYFKAVS